MKSIPGENIQKLPEMTYEFDEPNVLIERTQNDSGTISPCRLVPKAHNQTSALRIFLQKKVIFRKIFQVQTGIVIPDENPEIRTDLRFSSSAVTVDKDNSFSIPAISFTDYAKTFTNTIK